MSYGLEDYTHEELMALYDAGRLARGGLQPPGKSDDELDALALTIEQFGWVTCALVEEVWRLRSIIAVRQQNDRIAEQIEQGYR